MNTKYIHIGKSTILWEKTSFSRAFKFLKNNSLSRAELSDDNGNVKNIHYGDILIKFSECLYADEGNSIPYIINDNIAYKLLKLSPLINGDIVFADAAEDNTVGKCIEIITRHLMFWRMPSSSRAYPLSLEKKAEAYRNMFISAGLLQS